jgi:soluble lytic murein transglycosylase-like protein
MPELPSIASTSNRRVLPQAELQIGGASPAAFGAGVGDALQGLGEQGRQVAGAIDSLRLAKVQEADQAAEFDRQAQFVKFGSAESDRLDNAARDINGSALGFTKDFMTSFDQRRDQFLEAIPERHRSQWAAKFEALRGQVAGAALKAEFGQRDAWSRDSLKTGLNQLQNGVAQNPTRSDDYRVQGEELINSSLLSRQDKAEAITSWRSNVALAAAMGDVQIDPNGALHRLGGIDPVTVYDYETGNPKPGALEGSISVPNKQTLFSAVEHVESSSQRGIAGPQTDYGRAHGLMQVLDSTGKEVAKKLGVAWRPDLMRGSSDEAASYQRQIGQAYFEEGLEKYGGDVRKALMFYHGGPDERKWGKKTHAYVGKVLAALPNGAAVVIPAVAMKDDTTPKLKPIPAGWKGNQEDAIQELGMTADQAAHFLATGEDTRSPNGMIQPGNIDVSNLPAVPNPDGTVSTVRSISIEQDGETYLIPTVINGKVVSNDEAIASFKKTGKNLGVFADEKSADTYAEQLHNSEARRVGAMGATYSEAPAVDPRYADLPFSARMQVIESAQREIEHREQVQYAIEQKQHGDQLNGLLNDLNDGKAGTADIDAARKAGWLTDYGEINQAQGILEARNKKHADLDYFNAMMNTPGFAFNHFDSDQKKAVDAGVEALGNTPMAAFQVWQKTGILAAKGAQALRGSILSTDPKQVAEAASIASNMIERDPNAFTGVDGGEDIEKNAMMYRHLVSDLGKSQEEAVQSIASGNSPEAKRKLAANADEEKDFRKQLSTSHIDAALSNKLGGWFVRDPDFTSPEQTAAVRQDFVDLAWDHYREHHDTEAAKTYATQQIDKLYGAVDGRLMKYPPTRAYPAVNGSYDYIFEQAVKDIKGATGKTVKPSDVYLMPLPTATAEAFRSGRPVPYELHYIEHVDGQPVYQVLHGKAFIADVAQERKRAGSSNAELFAQGKRDRAALDRALSAQRIVPGMRGRDY